mmetsp:Transcript_147569/g.282872  ORF Transcript_147569/g.282872 Transcript_147569/m.282872 type:complete len:195 (-) Transcript_147569:67-651(-)
MIDTRSEQVQVGELVIVKLIDFGSARRELRNSSRSSSKESVSSLASSFHEDTDRQILPPAHAAGRGDMFQLDVFATGLIVVGLLAKQEIFTCDVFPEFDFNTRLPTISPTAQKYVSDMLNPDPRLRHSIDVALQDLPCPQSWFTERQCRAVEAVPEQVSSVMDLQAWRTVFAVGSTAVIASALLFARWRLKART